MQKISSLRRLIDVLCDPTGRTLDEAADCAREEDRWFLRGVSDAIEGEPRDKGAAEYAEDYDEGYCLGGGHG